MLLILKQKMLVLLIFIKLYAHNYQYAYMQINNELLYKYDAASFLLDNGSGYVNVESSQLYLATKLSC